MLYLGRAPVVLGSVVTEHGLYEQPQRVAASMRDQRVQVEPLVSNLCTARHFERVQSLLVGPDQKNGKVVMSRRFGEIVTQDGGSVTLSVDREKTPETVSRILQRHAVRDIVIDDISLEEVIHDLFTGRE